MRDFVHLANAINRNANYAYDYERNGGSSEATSHANQNLRLPVDVWTDENGFTFKAYLPGVKPEDVEITYEGDDLFIRGQMGSFHSETDGEEQPKVEWLRKELFHGSFERRFSFNTAIDADKIQAEFENGVLTLFVPKAEEVKPKQIAVKAK